MVVEMAARQVVDADLGDIAKFLTLSFGGSESHYRQLFSYWWESNSCWHGGLPKGWAIKSPDGDIIAFTANIPFAYVINGQAGKCFVTGYTCVDENWRGHKLSKKIGGAFLAQDDADLLIGTDSTPPAYQLWLGLGMRPLKRNWREKSCRVLGGADHLLDARRPYLRALAPWEVWAALRSRWRKCRVPRFRGRSRRGKSQVSTFQGPNVSKRSGRNSLRPPMPCAIARRSTGCISAAITCARTEPCSPRSTAVRLSAILP